MDRCPECGESLGSGVAYCDRCGATVLVSDPSRTIAEDSGLAPGAVAAFGALSTALVLFIVAMPLLLGIYVFASNRTSSSARFNPITDVLTLGVAVLLLAAVILKVRAARRRD